MNRILISSFSILALALTLYSVSSSQSQPPGNRPPGIRNAAPNQRPESQPRFEPPPPPLFETLDADGDGEISRAELKNASQALSKLDRNQDNQLTFDEIPRGTRPDFGGPPPGGGPGFGGPGGPGGPNRETMKLLDKFDLNKDGYLDDAERPAARRYAKENRPAAGSRRGGPGGRGRTGRGTGGGRGGAGPRQDEPEPEPGRSLTLAEVESYASRELYDTKIIRTLFFEFNSEDWEEELEDFYSTDVEVPASLIADGQTYDPVGLRFRGNSSYFTLRRGQKRSFNVSIDLVNDKQRLYGHRTLNLLNSHADPSFLRTLLFNHIARNYVPTLESNVVRVVVNGESWGLYVSEEQFNKDFLRKWFANDDGVRWKVPPNFNGSGGLMNLGPDVDSYKPFYQPKSNASDEAWQALVDLCQKLDRLPDDQLESELNQILNIDGALFMLALENVFIDGDGYISRASDYSMYFDSARGRFHLLSRDNNETFRPQGGGPGARGPSSGMRMDPLTGMDDDRRPLIKRLLRVPELRARYLAHVHTIASKWLDWNHLGPLYQKYHAMLDADVQLDTRKLYAYEQFANADLNPEGGRPGPGSAPPGLKIFAEQRREFLMDHVAVNSARPEIQEVTHKRDADVLHVKAEVSKKHQPDSVLLYYTSVEGAPFQVVEMFDDGNHHDKKADDGIYGAAIPVLRPGIQIRYYIEARALQSLGTTVFSPSNTEQGAYSYRSIVPPTAITPVVINELMAANKRTVADPQGEFDDWIELHNRSDQTVDLSGIFLSDANGALRKWSFPPGTTIAPRGYLIVWADEDGKDEEGLHANFKLSASGEELFLTDTDKRGNTVLDQIEFGKLKNGVSFGRGPDGTWQPTIPTPGESNRIE